MLDVSLSTPVYFWWKVFSCRENSFSFVNVHQQKKVLLFSRYIPALDLYTENDDTIFILLPIVCKSASASEKSAVLDDCSCSCLLAFIYSERHINIWRGSISKWLKLNSTSKEKIFLSYYYMGMMYWTVYFYIYTILRWRAVYHPSPVQFLDLSIFIIRFCVGGCDTYMYLYIYCLSIYSAASLATIYRLEYNTKPTWFHPIYIYIFKKGYHIYSSIFNIVIVAVYIKVVLIVSYILISIYLWMMYRLYNEKSGVLRNRTLGHVFIVDVECQVSSHLFGRTYIVLLHHEAISFSFSPVQVLK